MRLAGNCLFIQLLIHLVVYLPYLKCADTNFCLQGCEKGSFCFFGFWMFLVFASHLPLVCVAANQPFTVINELEKQSKGLKGFVRLSQKKNRNTEKNARGGNSRGKQNYLTARSWGVEHAAGRRLVKCGAGNKLSLERCAPIMHCCCE